MDPLRRGFLETAAVLGAFLVFGLAWASFVAPGPAPADVYAPGVPEPSTEATRSPRVWLVDGYNVLCTGLLGGRDRHEWWRAERREELIALLESFEDPDVEIWVVFDGERDCADAPTPRDRRIRTVFAASADDWLAAQVRTRPAADAIAVVTADRRVAGRARHRGAQVVSPKDLLERCMG
jgi:predicted RNA-binding protein with PIN domain